MRTYGHGEDDGGVVLGGNAVQSLQVAQLEKKNIVIVEKRASSSSLLFSSPVRYAKFESIRYFIDIDILQNCLIDIDIDIDIFQNHHIDIDIFGIALSISISISIFFRIALSISISISIFSTSPYRYRYRYRYFSKVSIYRQSIFHIDILTRRRSKKNVFYRCTRGRSNKMCFTGAKNAFFITFSWNVILYSSLQHP